MSFSELHRALQHQPGDAGLFGQLLSVVEKELTRNEAGEGKAATVPPDDGDQLLCDLPSSYSVVDTDHPLFIIATCPSMGRVVVARHALPCGTELIRERAILSCNRNASAVQRLQAYVTAAAGVDDHLRLQMFDFACPLEAVPAERWKALELEAEKALRGLARALGEGATIPLDRAAAACLLCIWQVNGLSSGALDCLFPLASRLEHSCAPNCTTYFVAPDTISGEHLSISYRWQHTPTADRMASLSDGYFFDCCCPLCSGPDFARSFVCPACGAGPAYPERGGSAAAQCIGMMAAAFGMGASACSMQCMWCGTAVCATSARPQCSRSLAHKGACPQSRPITCTICGTLFPADSTEVQVLESWEEEAQGSPAFQRDLPALLAQRALHWSHHLVFHAATERLLHAESIDEVETLTGYILGTFDLAHGALHSSKAEYYEFLARGYVRAGMLEKAKLALRAAYIIRWLGCGHDAPDVQRLKAALEDPCLMLVPSAPPLDPH
eukprot:GGOE01022225.1.p1 GENE.GGOE01022225.1~~GGOE01022225.1.p1  ORF type:complete len:498 (-),score=107.74 GGOE01022225.1:57-1550(-)